MEKMRLIFMGTPEFAVPPLSALLNAGYDVVAVYSQPPRPSGRGQRQLCSPVHRLALDKGIEVRTPASLKSSDQHAAFARLEADICVVAAYGLILPNELLEAPRMGCVNIHASLLPRWRGASPIQRAIEAGDRETGITIMEVEEKLDAGPVLITGKVPITPLSTASSLHDELSLLGGELIVKALSGISEGSISAIPQPAVGITYADKLKRDEGRIKWDRPAVRIERQVRALNPWPGVWFEHSGQRFKVLAASVAEGTAEPGRIIAPPLTIACGEDALSVHRIQRQGKSPADVGDFLRGYSLDVGEKLD